LNLNEKDVVLQSVGYASPTGGNKRRDFIARHLVESSLLSKKLAKWQTGRVSHSV